MFGPLFEVLMSKNCTPLWRKAHLEVKMYKTPHVWTTFREFWCRKIARRCGEKHIWKSKCTKHRMFGPLFEVLMSKNCTPLWRKAHLEVKMLKKLTVREHFLKFWCRKIARRCGEKHIWKSKCTKHRMFGPLFEVLMSKNCTPLWRKAHLEVKMLKNCSPRSTFWGSDVEKLVR